MWNESGETGHLAEEYLGGRTTVPILDPGIVDQLAAENALIHVGSRSLSGESIERLPDVVKQLVMLSDTFNKSRIPQQRDAVRDQMFQIKRGFRDSSVLKEALIRYVIRAQPEGVNPTEPGTLDDRLPMSHRNNFIFHLHSDICNRLKVEDSSLVRWYSAVGTPLDHLFGMDGFFVVDGQAFRDGERRLLPVDITVNTRKVNEFREDGGETDSSQPVMRYDSLLLPIEDLEDENVRGLSDRFAGQIAQVLRGRSSPDRFLDEFRLEGM